MKMRRWLAGLLTVILLVALLPASALAIQTELPNGPITRAQAALAVAETYGWTETPFVDIDGCSDLQKEAITALYAAGIVSGTDATHFTPDGMPPRYEAVILLWRVTGMDTTAE